MVSLLLAGLFLLLGLFNWRRARQHAINILAFVFTTSSSNRTGSFTLLLFLLDLLVCCSREYAQRMSLKVCAKEYIWFVEAKGHYSLPFVVVSSISSTLSSTRQYNNVDRSDLYICPPALLLFSFLFVFSVLMGFLFLVAPTSSEDLDRVNLLVVRMLLSG